MNIITRAIQALRSTKEPRSPSEQRLYMGKNAAGVRIDPESASQISAVWAAKRYLSQTTAVLPWHVMHETARGAEIYSKHPTDWLLWKRPSPEWSSFQFRETLTQWALMHGNGYAEIERDTVGRPFALHPIHPSRVRVCRDEVTGGLFYEVSNGVGGTVDVKAADIFHIRGYGDGPVGVNFIDYASQSLGWVKAVQLYAGSFFGNGANISGVVTLKKGTFADGTISRLRAQFGQLYKGVSNANKTAFLDADMEWSPLGVDPEKAQLIEVHQALVAEVARWFGVPPHKLMDLSRATFSNIEHQAIEVVVDSIAPWVKRFEDEADYKLFGGNRQGLFTKINMNALMRGDTKSRMEFYRGMREIGAYSANDILRRENEPTIGADGDKRIVNQTYTTLERIGEDAPEPTSAPVEPSVDDGEDDDAEMIDEIANRLSRSINV